VAFVLERPLVLDEAVVVGPEAGFGAPCAPELGLGQCQGSAGGWESGKLAILRATGSPAPMVTLNTSPAIP
jgi:hypothetical protein